MIRTEDKRPGVSRTLEVGIWNVRSISHRESELEEIL
jgi:hypothetical protein